MNKMILKIYDKHCSLKIEESKRSDVEGTDRESNIRERSLKTLKQFRG